MEHITEEIALANENTPNLLVTTKVDGAYVATNAGQLPANEAFGIELTLPEETLKRLPDVNDIALPTAALLLLAASFIISKASKTRLKKKLGFGRFMALLLLCAGALAIGLLCGEQAVCPR